MESTSTFGFARPLGETEGQEAIPPALSGVRVLDLTHQVAGPTATLALAAMGAEVVKVIVPGSRDSYDPPPFYLVNASKKSIELDLKSTEGHETVLKLAARADVFVENFSPGVIERLDLTYEKLSAINPRLIYAQIHGFASASPYASFPCVDPIAQGFGGASAISGEPEGIPIKPGPDVGDTGTGQMTAMAIIAALYQRQSTGLGQHIEVSMADNVATFIRIQYGYAMQWKRPTPRNGNGPPGGIRTSPSDMYPCKPLGPNDYVHIHCQNEKHMVLFWNLIGRPDLAEDKDWCTTEGRRAHSDEIDQIVSDWTRQRTKMEAMEIVGGAGIPAGAVRDTLEILADKDLADREILVPTEHPKWGEVKIPSLPMKMSRSPMRITPPPLPGADTEAVLASWLGADD
jgi:formyl-CoA transferase